MTEFVRQQSELQSKMLTTYSKTTKTATTFNKGMSNYLELFSKPQQSAIESFFHLQQQKAGTIPSESDQKDLADLLQFNFELAGKALQSTLTSMADFHMRSLSEFLAATLNTALSDNKDGEEFFKYVEKQMKLVDTVVHDYPQAIRDIETEYGFHFEEKGYNKVAETDRFLLYQVLPSDKKVSVRSTGKPVLLIPPYVLGENILCFLYKEDKSYAHAYANQGVPTYVRVVKDIATTPAVQDMTGEDDVMDTQYFCEQIKKIHGRPLTLNGYCQGGFIATLNILSGKLDGLVDSLITCVSPLDGTRSIALAEFMDNIPKSFTKLEYSVSTLPNGKPVVNGKIMSWVYKLKSIETEAPLVTFYRDLAMFEKLIESDKEVSKTALAINHWLLHDQADMPVAITQLSFDSYATPVDKDGALPIHLFGNQLNFKRLTEKGIKVLICVAASDDLVDREAATAACDFIDAEVTVFPKGHAAIATSWSHPESKYALHTKFENNERGPVRFHLDLESEQDKANTPKTTTIKPEKTKLKPTKKHSPAKKTTSKKPVQPAIAKLKSVKTSTTKGSTVKTSAKKAGATKAKPAKSLHKTATSKVVADDTTKTKKESKK